MLPAERDHARRWFSRHRRPARAVVTLNSQTHLGNLLAGRPAALLGHLQGQWEVVRAGRGRHGQATAMRAAGLSAGRCSAAPSWLSSWREPSLPWAPSAAERAKVSDRDSNDVQQLSAPAGRLARTLGCVGGCAGCEREGGRSACSVGSQTQMQAQYKCNFAAALTPRPTPDCTETAGMNTERRVPAGIQALCQLLCRGGVQALY